ncbi:hypothetical protein N7494_004044 [Penicillium frequentans]|uniref:Uncharacterized protein n=1 Tax=Penicillium frequentans TaxID=3151616 RepID=A0AAD6D149_9EURO|nr:hypothetical protein N7494_004044 [Penicillium glabrum]
MLLFLFISMILSSFQTCTGTPTYAEEYRNSAYAPDFIKTPLGFQILAPDTPYVAAAGRNQLYFIDTRFDNASAQHIKNQIQRATIPIPDEYFAIDEITATAEIKNSKTGETTFVFDPPYARVLFAQGMNRANPELKLPEHEPAGDWLVAYDMDEIAEGYTSAGNNLTSRVTKRVVCSNFGCYNNEHCLEQSTACDLCHKYRVDNWCDAGRNVNAIGSCIRICTKVVDTPREDGETDASYYERMDKLHWH